MRAALLIGMLVMQDTTTRRTVCPPLEPARSSAAVARFKRASGRPLGWPGHVVDHIVPLCAGGADLPSNMQWQTAAASMKKDRRERALCDSLRRAKRVVAP